MLDCASRACLRLVCSATWHLPRSTSAAPVTRGDLTESAISDKLLPMRRTQCLAFSRDKGQRASQTSFFALKCRHEDSFFRTFLRALYAGNIIMSRFVKVAWKSKQTACSEAYYWWNLTQKRKKRWGKKVGDLFRSEICNVFPALEALFHLNDISIDLSRREEAADSVRELAIISYYNKSCLLASSDCLNISLHL